ncbi:MAG: carboxypeptidase regulatory-like domain-containing protein [Archangium sp.]|nr:carboxypeptidase regulatory-like domain-containing protein [Archangium sp.]
MHRRFPTAILLIVGLLGAAAHAAGDPVRPSIASVSLSGGFSVRDTTYALGPTQGRTTQISGTSLWLFRLRADWFPIRWLGVEGDGSGDFFRALKPTPTKDPLQNASQRGAGRLAVALRYVTDGGFVLNGSLGYGFSVAPVVRINPANLAAEPLADGLLSHGPMARFGVGYSGERFEGLASVIAMFALGQQVNSLEPQLWLAGRVADLGPTALWVGLEGALLLEASPAAVGYSGPTFRFALGLKLQLLPPAPPPKPIVDGVTNETTLQLSVRLPDGAPALGALVTLDDAAPAPVDGLGQLVTSPKPGPHTASAKLSGYRAAKGDAQVVEGKQTALVLRLEALTGPGQLSGTVRASSSGKPVPEATVTAEGLPPVTTGGDGTYRFEKLGPGPVKVRVEAQGFNPTDEIAQVPPESAATLDVQLEALGKGSPATVRGLIRSRTGEALKASVVIKGLATKVQVTPEGRFFVTVPGGTYQFVISAPGYVTQSKKVVLADGDQAIVHTELQKVSK